MVDESKLHQFIGQMLSDLGGAASIALVRMGDPAILQYAHMQPLISRTTRASATRCSRNLTSQYTRFTLNETSSCAGRRVRERRLNPKFGSIMRS